MSNPLTIRVLTEAEHPAWARFVEESPDGSAYSRPEYLSALCEAAGGVFRILAAFRGETLVGGITLWERTCPAGTFVAPRLLLYYNGVVLRHYPTRYPSERTARHLEILDELAGALERARYGKVELRNRSSVRDVRPFLERGWSALPGYTYVVPLTDLEDQRGRVAHDLRRLVDRCARQGIEVTEDDDFDSYYRMHAETHRRKGAPLYLPRGAYATWFERLRASGLCRLYHARLPDGRSISSQIVLVGHPTTHTVSAAAAAEHRELGATAYLRWRVLEDLAADGYVANDLTDASLNPVTRFKSQLGGALELSLVVSQPRTVRFVAYEMGRGAGRSVRDRLSAMAARASRERAP